MLPQLGDKWIGPNQIKCISATVIPKSWLVRLLEFLHLRQKVWEVSYKFEVMPETRSGT